MLGGEPGVNKMGQWGSGGKRVLVNVWALKRQICESRRSQLVTLFVTALLVIWTRTQLQTLPIFGSIYFTEKKKNGNRIVTPYEVIIKKKIRSSTHKSWKLYTWSFKMGQSISMVEVWKVIILSVLEKQKWLEKKDGRVHGKSTDKTDF